MADTYLSISFVTSAQQSIQDAILDVALDDIYNDDKSSFLYGSKAYYKIYPYPFDSVITQLKSDGVITEEGSGYEEHTEYLNFVNSNESSASHAIYNIIASSWFGNNLGAISFVGKTITSSQSGVGVLKINYRTYFKRYAITVSLKAEPLYYVLVYISI